MSKDMAGEVPIVVPGAVPDGGIPKNSPPPLQPVYEPYAKDPAKADLPYEPYDKI